MANLIRLKQIESSSFLETAGAIVQDFSQSVNSIISQSIETTFSASIVQIITNNVGAVLPNGVISSSVQVIDILIPLNQHSASIPIHRIIEFYICNRCWISRISI